MATLLVIGGSGFFGKSILDMFQRGKLAPWNVDKVIAMSRSARRLMLEAPELVRGNVELIESDIATANYLPDADYVIHAAASTDARNYINSGDKERENIQAGTLNYCRLAKKNKRNAKNIYVSSGAVYGTQPEQLFSIEETYKFTDPSDIPEGKRDYSVAKRDAEDLIIKLGDEGFSVSIARCFAFVGKYLPRDQHFAIGNFIDDVINKRPIVVKANHQVYRSYMYADDLVEWLMTIADEASPKCPIYNVGSDQTIHISDLARELAKSYHVLAEIPLISNSKVDRYIPSIKKAKKELGLLLKYSLTESIDETIRELGVKQLINE
ncbi:WcaG Nucleoside-diphosphate-sugar epimerases [Methylophilaceae bacterium]